MPFTELQKKRSRKLSDYACCVCRDRVGVDIHHIIPEGAGGPNVEGNAAALCSRCHDLLGPNDSKRKYITECRDHWIETCNAKDPAALQKAFESYFSALNASVKIEIGTGFERIREGLSQAISLDPLSSERSNDKLSLADFIRFIYVAPTFGKKYEDIPLRLVEFLWEFLIGEPIWTDPDALLERNDFLRIYGEATGKRVLLWELSNAHFDPFGFTTKQVSEMLLQLEVSMCLYNRHEDLNREDRYNFKVTEGQLYISLSQSPKDD
jgi:hypothetical protein